MSDEISYVRASFLRAASALGISVELPPIESLESINEHLVVHILHFGNSKGCVPVLLDAPSSAVEAIQSAGYYCSLLSGSYAQFDATLFRDTLNDWGFFGPAQQRPRWCTGQSWS